MNRRKLIFFILVNAFVSLTIAVSVVWVADQRRPGPDEFIVQAPAVVMIATPAPAGASPTLEATNVPPVTPTVAAAPTETGETAIYVVERGDSLLAIAGRFGLTLGRLMEVNDLTDPDFVFIGQRLVIPASQGGIGLPADTAAGLPQRGLRLRIEDAGVLATEAVQVLNDTDGAVDLQGWSLSRDGGAIYTFGSSLLFPGSGIHLYTGAGQDNSLNRYWGRTAAVWEAGSAIVLRNPGGELVAEITVTGLDQ